ncbi:uncharacterized protein LOC103031551 [Astyanax mexicanus]|uniref:uncharacterized protein LOC103031551 n=1 Tax=Astyanax mexicanus TaxID=7994 RepID=UPI0020CAAD5C|nr:uncharacterized protein LOC103031551 [Astyanax mexicanus]
MEDGQTDCMGVHNEIQTETQSVPLSQPSEEQPIIQQDNQDQENPKSCSENEQETHADPELEEKNQKPHEESEEYEEEQNLDRQQEEWFELEEQLQSSYLMSGYEGVPTNTKGISSELCWYCIKSLPSEEQSLPQLQLENEALATLNGGEHLNYLQDPRPHFGVARSSRSIPFPLWDSERPREMKRDADEEDADFVTSCPHCHLGLPLDTLRWHEEKCLSFEGPKTDA